MAITREDLPRLQMKAISGNTIRRAINILGAGGVGSNIVRSLLTIQEDTRVRIFDFDTIELHNLNRSSLFPMALAIGSSTQTKVSVISGSFFKRIPEHRNIELSAQCISVNAETNLPSALTIDARDTMNPLHMHASALVKLAYDGGSNISFTWHPKIVADKVVDLNRRSQYDVVPSFYVPAALLGVAVFRFLQFRNFMEIPETRATTTNYNIDELLTDVSFVWEQETTEGESEQV